MEYEPSEIHETYEGYGSYVNNMKIKFLLLCTLILAALLRFYDLGGMPEGFHRDEAFLGYNAYSILKTSRDIAGNVFPLHLSSFLYSPAGYSYVSLPFIVLFGLNEFSVRFASALFGVATVFALYGLAKEMLTHTFKLKKDYDPAVVAAIAAGALAISPWHINLSRVATEHVPAVFFLLLGTWLYLRLVRSGKLGLLGVLGVFGCFGITYLFYQAPRAFLPLFLPLLFFVAPPKAVKDRILAGAGYLLFIIVPVLLILSSENLSLRIRTVSIMADEHLTLIREEALREDGTQAISPLIARMFHNKILSFADRFFEHYFSHFSYAFLFTDQGFPDRYRVPGYGLLHYFDIVLLVIGGIIVVRRYPKLAALAGGCIVLSPVGSALTYADVPNLQRTLMIAPMLAILSAIGIRWLSAVLGSLGNLGKWSGILFGTVVFLYSIFSYLHQYYIHQPAHRPWYRHEGYRELVAKVNDLLPAYEKAVISTTQSAPTIFFLFYGKYDPSAFQEIARVSALRDFDRIPFGPYEFSQEECPYEGEPVTDPRTGVRKPAFVGVPDVLYVTHGRCIDATLPIRQIDEIRRTDGTVVFRILEVTE